MLGRHFEGWNNGIERVKKKKKKDIERTGQEWKSREM